eukprot:CAMPEP_0115064776 /NCGR_PEP_ID=MMETSP0227-20121206/9882_1 /TAXON_ID=89957 /ORGANISM="Polarella glacialis, Strain CCMP 1383" /LENGTH=415 /DNA_ID=CAMNT_0002450489 /DNA_START=86 /DNA_END=1333 /DNA_ORIENTATION=+
MSSRSGANAIVARQHEGSTGSVAATVGCAVVGLLIAGPVGALIGGFAQLAVASHRDRRWQQAQPLRISGVSIPPSCTMEVNGVTFLAVDVVPAGGGPSWRVMRRYNDFLRLSRQFRFLRFPFPRKHWFGCTGHRLEERRRGLEAWLRCAVAASMGERISNKAAAGLKIFLGCGAQELAPALQAGQAQQQFLRVLVPVGCQPGQEISFTAPDGRQLTVVVPLGASPGMELQVPLGPASAGPSWNPAVQEAQAQAPPSNQAPAAAAAAVAAPSCETCSLQETCSFQTVLLSIQVPQGVLPGQLLGVKVPDGRELTVVVPEGAGPELQLQFDPVAGTLTPLSAWESPASVPAAAAGASDQSVVLSIQVPAGVTAGQTLEVMVPDGCKMLVTVPEGATAGTSFLVRFDPMQGTLVPVTL